MIRATARFAAASLVLVALTGWLLALAWPTTEARHALVVSAEVALVVQLFAFAAARLAGRSNILAAWGMGMLMRFVVLVAYALVAARAFGLPLTPALIGLVAYFFVTSLLEPVLLTS